MTKTIYFEIAENKFKEIQNRFPDLKMILKYDDQELDLSMNIPKQSGVDFEINLNLQNEDELHISTAYIWCQFFSVNSDEIVKIFSESAIGLISGEYRIRQFVRNGTVYKTFLEKPIDRKWETVYTGFERWRMPWIKVYENIIQNKKESKLIEVYKAIS